MTFMVPATFVADSGARSYQVSGEDCLVLAKSMWGECGGRPSERSCAAVAWCEMQRFMLWANRPESWETWSDFLTAFSSPINPRFELTPWRAMIRAASWEEIPANIRQWALDFCEGRLSNPVPWAVDFADASWMRGQGDDFDEEIGGNGFQGRKLAGMKWLSGNVVAVPPAENMPEEVPEDVARWPEVHAEVDPGGEQGGSVAWSVLGLLVVLAAVWFAARSLR